jgi:hypothetical protein
MVNLILDLDGTLIDSGYAPPNYCKVEIYERPHLKEFFAWAFTQFERVSIWTNGSKEWYNKCYQTVLYKHIPLDKCFDFVITYDNGFVLSREYSPKRLSIVYNLNMNYTTNNTFIMDDSPHTYKCNPDNAIPICSFVYNEDAEQDEIDHELLSIMKLPVNRFTNMVNIES